MKKHKKTVLVLAALAVLAAGCGLMFFAKNGKIGGGGMVQGGPGQAMAQQTAATVVKAAAPETGTLELTTGLTGTVEPSDVVYVYAKASGDVTEVKVKSAELQHQSAKLAYDKQVEYSTVTAAISGVIESCDIEVYDRVSQNTQLCVISGAGEKTVSFYVTQRMLENVREGDRLTIEKSGNSYEAYVSEVSSMVDTYTGLFKVKAQLADTDAIATGSTVKLLLVTDRTENAMLIPVDAVYYSGGDAYVYLYKDGKAETANIEVGIYDSEYAEGLSGLTAEDIVVSTWSSNLYEGAKIQIREEG